MNAPNKIYVLLDERSGSLSHTFTNVPCGYENCKDIEYIRKDALIEWLKNKIKVPDVGFITGLTYLAYQDIIEHLNEM